MPKYGVKYGVYCQKCDTPFIKYMNNRILKKKKNKTFLCKNAPCEIWPSILSLIPSLTYKIDKFQVLYWKRF